MGGRIYSDQQFPLTGRAMMGHVYSKAARRYLRGDFDNPRRSSGLAKSPEDLYYEEVKKEVKREVDREFGPILRLLEECSRYLERLAKPYGKRTRGVKA